MGGERDAYGEPKDGLKRKVDQSIEVAKPKAQELTARLSDDVEAKRARLAPHSTSPVYPSGAFSQPSFYDNSQNYPSQPASYSSYGSTPTSKKIPIPNDKVGVTIGKGRDTIKSLQVQSGTRIQIAKDAEANPTMCTKDVDLVGTADQVSRAEELIYGVVTEADAGGSASGAAHGVRSDPTGGEQLVMKFPDNRVGLLIGKGGETIKTIQNISGARVQIVPLRPPPNEILAERSVFINGTQEQIDSAQEMVNEIVREGRLRVPPMSVGLMQPPYTSPASWVPPGRAPNHPYQTGYDYEYSAPGAYPPAASYYGGYGTNPQAGWEWDQSYPMNAPPPLQNTSYNYYAQTDQTGSGPPVYNYGYGRSQAPAPSQSGNQSYPPQPASYGQSYPRQPLTTPVYGQPPTYESAAAKPVRTPPLNPVDSQGTQQSYSTPHTYQPSYGTNYPMASRPAYGAQQGYLANPAYDAQQGYLVPPASQPGYGLQQGYSVPPASQPSYGTQQGYSATPSSQPAYGSPQGYPASTAHNQAGYGGQHSSLPPPARPPYGQSAYPSQAQQAPSSAYPPPSYGQSQPNPSAQPHPPPHFSEHNGDGGGGGHGEAPSPAAQPTSHSSSKVPQL